MRAKRADVRRWSAAVTDIPLAEYRSRRAMLASHARGAGLSAIVVWSPPTLTYLTGNDISASAALVIDASGAATVVTDDYDTFNFESIGDDQLRIVPLPYVEDPFEKVVQHLVSSYGRGCVIGAELSGISWKARSLLGSAADVAAVDDRLTAMRLIKTEAELGLMRRAARSLEAGILAVQPDLSSPTTEATIASRLYAGIIAADSEPLASQPYVKSGARALLTHARWSSKPVAPDEHVLIEAAASIGRYHVAIMRSRLARDRSQHYLRAVAAVTAARDKYLESARPGVTAHEVHEEYVRTLRKEGVGAWNRHACGYSLGLASPPLWGETDLLFVTRNNQRELAPGMVLHLIAGLTEPALAVPHIGLSECVLITNTGCERLVHLPDFL